MAGLVSLLRVEIANDPAALGYTAPLLTGYISAQLQADHDAAHTAHLSDPTDKALRHGWAVLRDTIKGLTVSAYLADEANNNAIAELLNAATRPLENHAVTRGQVIGAMNPADIGAVSAADATKIGWVLSLDSIDLFDPSTVQILKTAFGVPSATVTNLIALRTGTQSRAQELSLPTGRVLPSHVAMARAGL